MVNEAPSAAPGPRVRPDAVAGCDVRLATVADAAIIARHRAEMFRDMGELLDVHYDAFVRASRRYVEETLESGAYIGWLAYETTRPTSIVAGAGVLLRSHPPRPVPEGVREGVQALVINVFTEAAWRRRGVAEMVMRRLLAWTTERGVASVVLHASADGRALYEKLGFRQTNEMRLNIG